MCVPCFTGCPRACAAHGRLYDAIKNGGCGTNFRWSSGQPVNATYKNIAGKSVTGQAPHMYAAEIRKLREELGFEDPECPGLKAWREKEAAAAAGAGAAESK